jgi:hypothetical protein
MKKNLLKISLAICFLLTDLVLFAQAGPGDDDGTGGLEGGDPVPIDDYIYVLALVGIVFAFYLYRKNRKIA